MFQSLAQRGVVGFTRVGVVFTVCLGAVAQLVALAEAPSHRCSVVLKLRLGVPKAQTLED